MRSKVLKTIGLVAAMVACVGMTVFAAPSPSASTIVTSAKSDKAEVTISELSDEDQATVVKARQLERFLTQPFATTKHFTGMEGKLVDLDQTLTGCEEILSGKYLDVSPNAFYMIGDISEAKLNIKDKEDKE